MPEAEHSPREGVGLTARPGRPLAAWLRLGSPEPAHQQLTLVAAMLALAMLLYDQSAVSVALPAIQRELDIGTVPLHWVINASLLTLAVCVAPGGRLVDIFTWRRIFPVGVAIFGVAAVGCGLAPDATWLIAARIGQGVGGALMMPAAYASVAAVFPRPERGRALGKMSGFGTSFLIVGPVLGGILTQEISWRLIFFLYPPLCLLTIGILLRVPAAEPQTGRGFDLRGAICLMGALTSFVLMLMQIRDWGLVSLATGSLLIASIVLFALFVVAETRGRDPLIPLRLFRLPAFAGAVVVVAGREIAVIGVTVFAALYLQLALGYSPIITGLLMLPTVVLSPPLSPLVGRWIGRFGPRLFIVGGMGLLAAGLLGIAASAPSERYAVLLLPFLVFGLGRALALTPANTIALNAVGDARRGVAAGVLVACRAIGSTVSVALLGAVLVAFEDRHLAAHLAHVGVSTRPEERDALDGLLAGTPHAHAKLATLPPALAAHVLHEAAKVYAAGFGFAMVAAALICLLALGLAAGATGERRRAAAPPVDATARE